MDMFLYAIFVCPGVYGGLLYLNYHLVSLHYLNLSILIFVALYIMTVTYKPLVIGTTKDVYSYSQPFLTFIFWSKNNSFAKCIFPGV